ncbi:MAG: hypothetical protein ACFWUJ_14940 [Pseudomonas fragi]
MISWGQRVERLVAAQRQTPADWRLLALVVVSGWQLWHKYQTNQSQGASVLYQQLLETTLTLTASLMWPVWRIWPTS